MNRLLCVVLLTAAFAAPAGATTMTARAVAPQFIQIAPVPPDTKEWYSLDNLSIAAGSSYRWWNGGDAVVLSPRKEFVFGLYNAWQLTEHVDAIGNVEYGVDTRSTGFTLGLRFVLKLPK